MVPGSCIGTSIGALAGVTDPYECLQLCKDTSDCAWFTSSPETEICMLLATCTLDTDSCPDCVSGM